MNDQLTHLSLFTGIGGIDLAAERAGFSTVGQVEQNKYALRVLRNRFGRTIPRWTDIRDLSAEDFVRRTGIDSPTIITGGFPCQPFSCAGKRRGKEDDRYLWPEMFRVMRELRPTWILGENVAGIVSMELEPCCSDLESEGYTVRAFLVPACGVGALHWRNRVFIVAHSESRRERGIPARSRCQGERAPDLNRSGETLAHTNCQGLQRTTSARVGGIRQPIESPKGGLISGGSPEGGNYWTVEPAVGRVAHGIPHRVDRLRCLGNAVVPQQVYPILAGIAQVEKENMRTSLDQR